MNAGLIILRVASERRNAQNERDGACLSSDSAAAPSQQHDNLEARTQLVVFVASLLEVLPSCQHHLEEAGGTRWHLEERRELRVALAPSQQHQLHRGDRSRRR